MCGKTRTYHQKKHKDLFPLFKQYVLWGFTYEILSSISGYSIRHLIHQFHQYLTLNPPYLPKLDQSETEVAYLLIDGLWFKRWYVMMVYRQSKNLRILHISVAGKEVSTKISKDLRHLTDNLGYRFTGIVSDGGTGIIKAVHDVFSHIPHQVCMAHMHRRIISSIGRRSNDHRVRELRKLADHIWLIESHEALNWWKKKVWKWERKNFWFLIERRKDTEGNWWYIHKGARKALRILQDLPRTSFKFLDHPLMPKTTNEIEAQFGHLSKRWLAHRGLKTERWENFMKWFVYFYNQEKLSRSSTKKD
ncbi:transposase [Patescibacteria group bacterium]|nr:transposase [Patescibacteria group bacterium]